MNIGQAPQLFFDNYLIEMVNFVTRTMHQPTKHSQNPMLRHDKPWEKVVIVRGLDSRRVQRWQGNLELRIADVARSRPVLETDSWNVGDRGRAVDLRRFRALPQQRWSPFVA